MQPRILPTPNLAVFDDDHSLTSAASPILQKIFSGSSFIEPLKFISNCRRVVSSKSKIVGLKDIHALLAESPVVNEGVQSGCKVLRYCLVDGEFRFGKEGAPTSTNDIPSHLWLVEAKGGRCFAAGNIWFDRYNRIQGMSNKSGDFRPSCKSLQLVFDRLIKLENELKKLGISLKETLTLEVTFNNMGGEIRAVQVALDDIRKKINVSMDSNKEAPISSSNASGTQQRKRSIPDLLGNLAGGLSTPPHSPTTTEEFKEENDVGVPSDKRLKSIVSSSSSSAATALLSLPTRTSTSTLFRLLPSTPPSPSDHGSLGAEQSGFRLT